MKEIYNIKTIVDNQIQAKITNFVIQINDRNELGKIMVIRLLNIQEELLLPNNPLICLTTEDITNYKKLFSYLKNSFILDNIRLMRDHNFSIKENFNFIENNKFKIIGGDILIKDIIYRKNYFKILKN